MMEMNLVCLQFFIIISNSEMNNHAYNLFGLLSNCSFKTKGWEQNHKTGLRRTANPAPQNLR